MGDVSLPPRWSFPQSSSRLRYEIPSLPALLAYRASLDNEPGKAWVPQWERDAADQAIDDARWRLACQSWNWCMVPRVRDVPLGEEMFWFAQRMVEALRFEERLAGRRVPGKELAVRGG
jgi:hypothetical protein